MGIRDRCITTTIRTSLIACATTSKPRVVFVLDLPLDTAIATLRLCVWLAKPMLDFVATASLLLDLPEFMYVTGLQNKDLCLFVLRAASG